MNMNNESIDNIASRLAEAVPQGLEFEVQEAVLAKTRAKLEALEATVREMEVGAKAPPAS